MNKEIQTAGRETTLVKERVEPKQVGQLLAAIGNHEGKAALLGAMVPQELYSQNELRKILLPENSPYRLTYPNTLAWCTRSLAPIGLVTKEVVDPELGVYGYGKTEVGHKLGTALAGHLLDFSEQHPETSLHDLLGSTHSGKKASVKENQNKEEEQARAPLTRSRIFYELVTADLPIRQIDLVKGMLQTYPDLENRSAHKFRSIINSHLNSLARANLLTYESPKEYKAISHFKFSTEGRSLPDVNKDTSTMTSEVYDILRNNPDVELTTDTIYRKLIQKHPEREQNDKTQVKGTLALTLAELSQQGYIEHGQFNYRQKTEVSLTDQQRTILTDFVTILDKFSSGDQAYLKEGHEKAHEIVNDQDRLDALLEKAKKTSPSASKTEISITDLRVSDYLTTHPRSTREQVREYLAENFKQTLTNAAVRTVMNRLTDQGIVADRNKGIYYYSSPENGDETQGETVIFEYAQK